MYVQVLNEVELEEKIVTTIARLYEQDESIIIKDGKKVGICKRTKGIKQGCKISSILFNLVLNNMIKQINFMFPYDTTNVLLYADDCMVIAINEKELKQKINIIKYEYQKMGLKINMEKSESIVFGSWT